jgi:two-component system cell cycle response regulator
MKILIAQDDKTSCQSLEATLTKWGHEVVVAPDGREALQGLQKEDAPRLAVLSSDLPGMDAFQVCRKVRKRPDGPYVYFIVTVPKGREEDIIEGIRAGVDDFLLTPLNPDELMTRLRVGKRILEMQGDLQRAHEAISYQTTHDPLTGLWNRTAILDGLRRELARVAREKSPVGVIVVEIDNFKSINETHGHMAGDAVLRETSRRIRSSVRPYDTVGRYGAQEFLVIVPGCDASNAQNQAERLRSCVSGELIDIAEWGKFASAEEGKIVVTICAGVAAGDKVKDAETLLQAGEAALARARAQGADRVELAAEAALL